MGFKARPNRYRKLLLTDQGAGLRLRGSRKEMVIGNITGSLTQGGLYSTPGTSTTTGGFISLFIKFYNQSVDQTIFGYARNADRGVLGKMSTGLSCYLEGGKVVVYHLPDSSTSSWWRVVCANAVPDIRHIHIQVVGGITGAALVTAPFLIWINGELQATTFTQGSGVLASAEWYFLYFGAQKEFGHDFLLKCVTIGRTRCTDAQRLLLYNGGRGMSFNQTQQHLGANLSLYYDWTKPAYGGFNASLTSSVTRYLAHFPGFTIADIAEGYTQYVQAQNGPSQILPHATRPVDLAFANFVYPDCKNFFRYGGYTGKWVQFNGSNEMPQNLGTLDISNNAHGSAVAPAVVGVPDAGSTEVTTITNSPLRTYIDANQTPAGFSELVYECNSPTMTDFNVTTARKSKVTFTLKSGVSQCVINNADVSNNYLDQTISSLWDWTKVLCKTVDVSMNLKLTGPIPNLSSLLVAFYGMDTGLTASPSAGWGTSTVKAYVQMHRAAFVGTHLLINVDRFDLSSSSLASPGTQQIGTYNPSSPTTTSNIVDMRSMVAGTTLAIGLSGANVSKLYFPPNGRLITDLAFSSNPDLSVLTIPSYRIMANTGVFSAYDCGVQPAYPLGTIFPARTIYIGQMPQAAFESSLTSLFTNTSLLLSSATAKHLSTYMGTPETNANIIPQSMVAALVNHCLTTNTLFHGWTPSFLKLILPVRAITQPPASYSFGGVTGNNQRIVVLTVAAPLNNQWPSSNTTFYLTDSTGGNPTMNGAWRVLARYSNASATGTAFLSMTGTAPYVVMERIDGTFNNTFTANELALISPQQGY